MQDKIIKFFKRGKEAGASNSSPNSLERETLYQAVSERKQFRMYIAHENKEMTAAGRATKIANGILTVEIDHIFPEEILSSNTVVFQYEVDTGQGGIFCSFSSMIVESSPTKLKTQVLHLTLPDRILIKRRRYLRYQPNEKEILRLELWAAKKLKAGQEKNYRDWGKPQLIYPCDDPLFSLLDISAGGMCVTVPARITSDLLSKDRKWFVRICLIDPEDWWSNTITLFSVIRSSSCQPEDEVRELGIQFIGEAEEKEGGELIWKKAASDGIPTVESWVFKRHLETCRLACRIE